MAYTPYSQALPDTSRYTLDPVLQERLYQPVRPDPYQSGMLRTTANDYYADPFGYTNRRFGKLDETLATDTPDVGLGGMFAPYLKNEGSPGDPIGLTEDQIDFFDTETEDAKNARMGRINSMLALLAQGIVPGLPTMSIAEMGLEAYNDMMQGHGRTVIGDTSGYTGQDSNMPSRQSGQPAPVVTGAEVQDAITEAKARNNYNSRFTPTNSGFFASGATAQAPTQSTATSQAASGSGAGPDGASSSDGPCCFIMLEARYGDGTMDSVVRKYRDEMMTDKNRRGYYKLAEVFVPLMRKSKVFKFLVKKTFADPLVSYGQWHYKKNKHGWLFAPLKNLWMKVFNILGSDTQFIRENGEVV